MNNSELLLNTPTLILIGGTLILGIFGGWFFASYLMGAAIPNHLRERKPNN
jgi:hypothetical protein